MKKTFYSLLKTENEEEKILSLIKNFLENHYEDGVVKEFLIQQEDWHNQLTEKTRIKISKSNFYSLTKKLNLIMKVELGEKDYEFVTKVLEVYLEEGLKYLQENDSTTNEQKAAFVKIIESIEGKYNSTKLKETYEKTKERFKKPLQITMKEEESNVEKIKIKAMSKLKAADFDFILKNREKHDEKDFEKFLKFLIKKEKEDLLLDSGIDVLEILKVKIDMYKNNEVEKVEVKYKQERCLNEKTNKQILEIIDVFEDGTDENEQIKHWNSKKSNEKKQEHSVTKEFNVVLEIVNEKLKTIDRIEELMYDKTLDYIGRDVATLEEKKETKFYTFIENDVYLELQKRKDLEKRPTSIILVKRKKEGVIKVTGKLMEQLDELFKEILKSGGIGTSFNEKGVEEYLEKIIPLQKNKLNDRNSMRKQWQLYTGILGEEMAVVIDYINGNKKFTEQLNENKLNMVSYVVELIAVDEQSTKYWYGEFLNHFGLKVESDIDLKHITRFNDNVNYWFVKNFYSHILDKVVQLYGEQKDEEFLKIFVKNYLK